MPCSLKVGRVQLPLVSGAKKAYDATMQAPIIIKGKDVSAILSQNRPDTRRRFNNVVLDLINPDRDENPAENPSDLMLRIEGAEA